MAAHADSHGHVPGHVHVHHPAHQHHFETLEQQAEASTLGMWLFLATEVMFFGGLLMAYLLYRVWYPAAWAEGSLELDIMLGGINVFFGPLVGAALLLVLNDFVTKVTEHYSLVLGVIILTFALGLRKGLLGFVLVAWKKYVSSALTTKNSAGPSGRS